MTKQKTEETIEPTKKPKAKKPQEGGGHPETAPKKKPPKAVEAVTEEIATETETETEVNPKSWGQNGPPVELPIAKMSDKERAVLLVSNGAGTGPRETYTLSELVGFFPFGKVSEKTAYSWVRNSMRRLTRSGMIERMDKGQYRITDAGRKKANRSLAAESAAA